MYHCLHVGVNGEEVRVLHRELGVFIVEAGGIKVIIKSESGDEIPEHLQEALQSVIVSAISAIVLGEFEGLQ